VIVVASVLCGRVQADPPDAGPPAHGAPAEGDDAGIVVAPARITPIVRRLVSRDADHQSCRVLASVRDEERYLCVITECPGGCQVTHVEVTIGVRGSRGRVISRVRRDVGDTGACGCCMTDPF
jgi:hypothetical protein